jgi:hypothetical protein
LVPTYILEGHFPNAFPADEDPVPQGGNPHPVHGPIDQVDSNVARHWHHDMVGAAQAVQANAGMNNEQI